MNVEKYKNIIIIIHIARWKKHKEIKYLSRSGAGLGAQSVGQSKSGHISTAATAISRHILQLPTARGSTTISRLQISKTDIFGGCFWTE